MHSGDFLTTPQLEAAIATIQMLSPSERHELLQVLVQSDSPLEPQYGLREKDGILVYDTESLDLIDFNELMAQSREKRNLEQIGL
jgi:hypothetical protein